MIMEKEIFDRVGSFFSPWKNSFDCFLSEIDLHFQNVVKKRLGWGELQEAKFKVGASSVVIRFRVGGEYFIFRVPKYSQRQLRACLIAWQHFADSGLMPEKIYHDEKCIVERFLPGHVLAEGPVGDCELEKMAEALRTLHSITATGFDRIAYDCEGENKNLADCFLPYVEPGINWLEEQRIIDNIRLSHLREIMSVMPDPAEKKVFICHGDMSAANIMVDRDAVRFIDWDGICAFPREYDFSYLNVDPGFRKWMDDLISAYGFSLNRELIDYFSFGNILRTLCTVNDPFRELNKFNDIFENLLLQTPVPRK
jgi:hypothetical protein